MNIDTFLNNLVAQPSTHKVITHFVDGSRREFDNAKSEKSANNYANMERRKIGRKLISRETGKIVVIKAVTIEVIK